MARPLSGLIAALSLLGAACGSPRSWSALSEAVARNDAAIVKTMLDAGLASPADSQFFDFRARASGLRRRAVRVVAPLVEVQALLDDELLEDTDVVVLVLVEIAVRIHMRKEGFDLALLAARLARVHAPEVVLETAPEPSAA